VAAESYDVQLAAVSAALIDDADQHVDAMLGLIHEQIAFHRIKVSAPDEVLKQTARSHFEFILGSLTAPDASFSTETAVETGRQRGKIGVPLTVLMGSYRVCARYIWDEICAEARRSGLVSDAGLVHAASTIWRALDEFTEAMVAGYQEVVTKQFLNREQERSAMVQALIEGRMPDTADLWNAVDTLGLSLRGPYIVLCAELASTGRAVLLDVEQRLSSIGVFSAWRLQPDTQIGILHLGDDQRLDALVETLRAYPATRIGISPLISDLAETARGLRYARTAMNASRLDRSSVTVFDRDALAVTAVGAPDLMVRISDNVLGALNDLPEHDRDVLLDTVEAWLDHGGSIDQIAHHMFCHPNTVRQRLRRLEAHTGRSVNNPRDAAELFIALEMVRRLPMTP
jgi:PucR C-terminal helix-turn-helix domain/GGDEF-like domain